VSAARVALFALTTAIALTALSACASSSSQSSTQTGVTATTATASAATASAATASTAPRATSSGNGTRQDLGIVDLRRGTGSRAMSGSCLYVHYDGSLPNGQAFETSRTTNAKGVANDPIALQLGAGMVMPGWEKGLGGMQVGGVRQLWIPFRLAYGASGRPPAIPPRTDLVFDVELLAVAAALPTSSNAPRSESARSCPTWNAARR
jgi:FKBP-type peptidyl-prolyl cis-trans isomerase